MDRQRPLRVLYSFPHALGAPGIGTTALQQVRGLLGEGAAVTVTCTRAEAPVTGAERLLTTMVVAGRRVPHRAVGVKRAMRYHDRRTARLLRRDRGRYDIVHCWPGGALATLTAAKALGVPAVLERPNTHTAFAYRVVAQEYERLGVTFPRWNAHRPDARRLAREEAEYRLATRLLAPSDAVAETFHARGFSPEWVARHRYGFDPQRFSAGAAARPQDAAFTAVFVGSCEPRKGLHHALDAWFRSGASQRGRLLVCGAFVPGYRELLDDQLRHPSVSILGHVTDVASVMRDSDVLVLPSIEEGSALVTYEAQSCGCVLVVSDAAGAVCEHDRTGLVHRAGDVDQLTEHLRRLSLDPGLLARMRAATLARRSQLTWAAAATRLHDIYRDVAGRASVAG